MIDFRDKRNNRLRLYAQCIDKIGLSSRFEDSSIQGMNVRLILFCFISYQHVIIQGELVV
jgi:hypothetical protein